MTSFISAAAIGLAFAGSAIAATPSAAADHHLFSYEDVFNLEFGTGMAVHPDGDLIIYERRSMDIMNDRQRSNLWMVDSDGGNHRPLLTGTTSYRAPAFSPSGDRLAYMTAADRGNQIYVRYMDTGQTVRVTDTQMSPGNLVWSPDGKMLAFTMRVSGGQKPMFTPPRAPKGAKWAGQPRLITEMNYRFDGVGFLPKGYTHIFVVPAEGGTPRQLTTGDFNHGGSLSWAKDGSAIYFSTNKNDDRKHDVRESNLFRIGLDGTLEQLTDRDGVETAPRISPDGETLMFGGFEEKGFSSQVANVYLMPTSGGEMRNLTADLDRSVSQAEWAPDGRSIMISYDDHGKKNLARLSLDGEVTQLTDAVGGTSMGRPYTSGNFTVMGRGAVFTHSRIDRPADLAVIDRRGNVSVITDLNSDALGHKKMAGVQHVTTKSSVDGLEIEGWLSLPPGVEDTTNLPLILEIHGGPHTAYGPGFSPEVQLYASKGYAVLYTNPRGSTSYGEEFANTIHQNYPSEDYNDLMDLVDVLVENGTVDADRLFVTGGSGGGVLSAWIVGMTDRFKAAVVAKPVINWISFTLNADIAAFVRRYWFDADVWDDISDHWKRSPLRLVGNVTTPTMLLTGARDLRTPMSETEQYYMALQMRDVDTALVQIPGAFHGIAARPSNLVQKVGHVLAWFDKYDKKEEEGDSEAN